MTDIVVEGQALTGTMFTGMVVVIVNSRTDVEETLRWFNNVLLPRCDPKTVHFAFVGGARLTPSEFREAILAEQDDELEALVTKAKAN